MRNMSSIGIHLHKWVEKGLLHFMATRPTLHGLEHHLTATIKLLNKVKPHIVVLDPIDAFVIANNQVEVKIMLLRLVDFLKTRNITAFFANLTDSNDNNEITDMSISSLIDTWLLLRDIEIGGERNQFSLELKRAAMEAQIVVLKSEFKETESEALKVIELEKAKTERFVLDKKQMGESRKADKLVRGKK